MDVDEKFTKLEILDVKLTQGGKENNFFDVFGKIVSLPSLKKLVFLQSNTTTVCSML